jgi:hypothetical protein
MKLDIKGMSCNLLIKAEVTVTNFAVFTLMA